MAENVVESVGAFIESFIAELEALESLPAHYWLRGQAAKSWTLVPPVERQAFQMVAEERAQKGLTRDAHKLEVSMLMRFSRELVDLHRHDLGAIGLYIAARHSGLPTRLLDWTASPLAALYFATSEESSEDAVVYGLDVEAYMREFAIKRQAALADVARRIPEDRRSKVQSLVDSYMCAPHTEESELLCAFIDSLAEGLFCQFLDAQSIICDAGLARRASAISTTAMLLPFLAVIPNRTEARYLAQESAFTLHFPVDPLDAFCSAYWETNDVRVARLDPHEWAKSAHMRTWRIPTSRRIRVLNELRLLGVTRARLFRDPDSIAKEVSRMYGL